ncbi:MAG: signal recognition particle-docking protein FtsY [Deltaproteobacteria bacterium]
MTEVPISLWVWGGAWLLCLLVALAAEWRRPDAEMAAPAATERSARETTAVPEDEPTLTQGDRFARGLARSRGALAGRLRDLLAGNPADAKLMDGLEEALIASDVGVVAATRLVGAVRDRLGAAADGRALENALREEIRALLGPMVAEEIGRPQGPWVQLVVGVNGVGKTTTIGKLAARHAAAGRRVLLIAGDTFRAAAADQLAIWAERSGADIVRQAPGSDPSAVVFDGLEAAKARGVDIVLIDTAGRLHTKVNLMEELKKVNRVIGRVVPGAPHDVLLILDATTGQNALAQARAFSAIVDVAGVVLTKLDGSARGGMAVAVRSELGLPIRFVGLGEGAADLQPFDPEAFLTGLLPEPASPPA